MLTASGGAFRGRSRASLAEVTPEEALNHPTWDMGPVVTVNTATLVNKGLEVIEAHLLFDIPYDRIDVVVHPQSYVHSMVEFTDGSTLAQVSPPDMRLPDRAGAGVARAGARCRRRRATGPRPSTWEFLPYDAEAFPAVVLAREVGTRGGTFPAVFNAANEECVAAFMAGTAAVPRHRRHGRRGRGRARVDGWELPLRCRCSLCGGRGPGSGPAPSAA